MVRSKSLLSPQEVEKIYRSFRVEFAKTAVSYCFGNEEMAQDAMQETLVRAAMKQDSFDPRYGRRGMHAWLLKILCRVCQEMRRKPKAESVDSSAFEEVHDSSEGNQYGAVLDDIERDEERGDLCEVIADTRLTNYEWAIVTATRLGFSNAEIARELGMKPNTVRAHLSNAMPLLRRSAQERSRRLDNRLTV